jgi:hypothetical protein
MKAKLVAFDEIQIDGERFRHVPSASATAGD